MERYKVQGVTHREKVGRRSDAAKLYAVRKADIHRGAKLPANIKNKGLKFEASARKRLLGISSMAAKIFAASVFA